MGEVAAIWGRPTSHTHTSRGLKRGEPCESAGAGGHDTCIVLTPYSHRTYIVFTSYLHRTYIVLTSYLLDRSQEAANE